MDLLHTIGSTYASFFDLEMWIEIFTNPVNWGLIATLVIMEGLLSADNAIALSVQVKPLPPVQRKKALMYGLWGAYLFRFIAIGLGTALTSIEWVKVVGAIYLLWLAVKFFIDHYKAKKVAENSGEEPEPVKVSWLVRYVGVFWATVISVEMMDIAFSIDSVLAAFAISDMVGILLLGGMLGILMMRGMATVFTKLMDKVPELEATAYVLIAFIGVKMLLTVHPFNIHIPHELFFAFVILSFIVTFVINKMKKSKTAEA